MREKIIAGHIYHVLNRGVDKRNIFLDEKDYFRFIHDLFEFNDTEPVNNITYFFRKNPKVIARPYITHKNENVKPRKLLVEILAFCLMPNHYHLLLRPRFDDGVTKFIKKLNMGYARYFNEKYKRRGTLFEGRYKAIVILRDEHFIHLPYYIHLNPLDLKFPTWRNREIKNHRAAIKFLENYRWSSFLDYAGWKNFPSVTQREFLTEFWGDAKNHKKELIKWLKEISLEEIREEALESLEISFRNPRS